MKHLILLMFTTLSAFGAWQSGDDLSSSTNWLPLTQSLRTHSVMNFHDDDTPWFGANYWLSRTTQSNALPNIDPSWYNTILFPTNGGWVWHDGFTDMAYDEDATVVASRIYPFDTKDGQAPYISWYVYEAQRHVTNWFNEGRVVLHGTETNWNSISNTGGSNLTLQAALELTGMTNGVRRTYDISATNVILITGSTTPDMSGTYIWSSPSYYNEDTTNKYIGCENPEDENKRYHLVYNAPATYYVWTNNLVDISIFNPILATLAAGTAYGEVEYGFVFTNGWAKSGDFTGYWHRDDLTNLLSVMKSGWYKPDKDGDEYHGEDVNHFLTIPNESIPLYLRSGGFLKYADWNFLSSMGGSTTKVDLIVTNAISPDCNGNYLEGYQYDYGRLDGLAFIEQPVSNIWILYGESNYVSVADSSNTVANGDYTYIDESNYTNANAWHIREDEDMCYLYPDNQDYAGYLIAVTGAVSPDITGGWELYSTPHQGEWKVVVTNGNSYILRSTKLTFSANLVNGTGEYSTTNVFWPDDPSEWGTYERGDFVWSFLGWTYSISDGDVSWANGLTDDPFATYTFTTGGTIWSGTATVERWVKSGTNLFGAYTPDPNSLVTGTAYLIDTSFKGYTNDVLDGEYGGVGAYSGDTSTVHAAYFYRDGTVTGVYENIGIATSTGTTEVLEGPGWIDWTGYSEATWDNAIGYISDNFSTLLSSNQAAMVLPTADFTYTAGKGNHDRRLSASISTRTSVPTNPCPTNVFKSIVLAIDEYESVVSPACRVAHKFGDGTSITSGRQLPSITNVCLFTENGYYTNTYGLVYSDGNTFPYVDFRICKFPSDTTYFKYYFSGLTNNPSGDDYPQPDAGIETNFVGWVMQFDIN